MKVKRRARSGSPANQPRRSGSKPVLQAGQGAPGGGRGGVNGLRSSVPRFVGRLRGTLSSAAPVATGSRAYVLTMDARLARARPETEPTVRAARSRSSGPTWSGSGSPSRSPGWPRSPRWSRAGATSGVVHNRLTHTIKVTAVARAVAVRLLRTEDRELLARARRARPRGRPGRGQRPRSRPSALRPSRRAGAGPARPRAVRADRRLRGQRADLPDPHRARGARARATSGST